ncbi:MAG: sigma-54-dependent Fis family transcriptional regulator [Deltaproteobacteria bacterium]|nr:sigma-54-dependent Fis family transcriptional regulator [Deltaproteobacteria bacterium]
MVPQMERNGIIGESNEIQEVLRIAEKVAASDSTILIYGETGTGKGLTAKAIHLNSLRAQKPFVAINCGAIPANLLESELFGHVRGAFTGALRNKTGKFEQANKGTIFLDEIGDMSPDLQVKLLRVLEEGEFEKVGGNETMRVDIRFIAATHRNLEDQVEKGLFREDLFYRLCVIPLTLPPLRCRRRDVPLLANHLLKNISEKNDYDIEGFTKEALNILSVYPWPGNVRELKNLVERLAVLKQEGIIEAYDLPGKIRGAAEVPLEESPMGITDEGICLNTAVSEFEKALILQSLQKAKGVKNEAAKLLSLKRTTLVEKIKRYHLDSRELMANRYAGSRPA